ncbi:hypothetical protein [Yersinia phage vB_YenP_ISAO8]|uniref:Uncharacterized protein n=1 Tax=Yersinia phage vB_YenP_ISAO8 TaxID=1675027 RepID=A0A0H4TJX7_9CAUD|nr:hypothetical protein AVU16_gp15 [Yersinia phage vB_YenP_ISAO8]AKQ07682.1 hypothetical protein [Yersinia phage vB_YenP_ISAO8]
MSKEWTENKGRQRSPVAKGTLIDVKVAIARHKGELIYAERYGDEAGKDVADWNVTGNIGDVVAWRLHEPALADG